MTAARKELTVGVDARSLLCREPRGEGKSLLRLYEEIARAEPAIRLIFFGDEHGTDFKAELPPRTTMQLLGSRGQRFDAWENIRLPLAAAMNRCDVLHCTSSGGPVWSSMPTLVTVHDLIPMLVDDGQTQAESARFERRLRRSLARAAAVIAVSKSTRADLIRSFPASASKVEVVYWGAPGMVPQSAVPAHRSRRRYLLAFGGTAPRKNTLYTLERFASIAARVPDVDLVFVGISSVAQRAEIEVQGQRAGLTGRVEMPGFVDEAELQALLGGAELVLYLSRYEGFGLPLLEAVAHGVPVVASNASAVQEVLNDGGSCHALDSPQRIEEEVLRILGDAGYRDARRRAQAVAADRFDWRETASRTLRLLRKAAGRPS